VSYEFGGERVATVNCPNCGVQRPVAIGVCPNCLMSTAPSGRRLARGLILTGIAIVAILAVGYLISRRTEQVKSAEGPAAGKTDTGLVADSMPSRDSSTLVASDTAALIDPAPAISAPTPIPVTANTPGRTAPPTAARAASPAASPTDAAKPASLNPPAPRSALPPSATAPDSGQWEFATANTWVRVRAAPTRESDVLRMVDSAQRVRLGPSVGGWRPVRVGVDRGWVDGRFFTVVPTPRP
jgi:hypothetical protein